jgi:hypothetical protein
MIPGSDAVEADYQGALAREMQRREMHDEIVAGCALLIEWQTAIDSARADIEAAAGSYFLLEATALARRRALPVEDQERLARELGESEQSEPEPTALQ